MFTHSEAKKTADKVFMKVALTDVAEFVCTLIQLNSVLVAGQK